MLRTIATAILILCATCDVKAQTLPMSGGNWAFGQYSGDFGTGFGHRGVSTQGWATETYVDSQGFRDAQIGTGPISRRQALLISADLRAGHANFSAGEMNTDVRYSRPETCSPGPASSLNLDGSTVRMRLCFPRGAAGLFWQGFVKDSQFRGSYGPALPIPLSWEGTCQELSFGITPQANFSANDVVLVGFKLGTSSSSGVQGVFELESYSLELPTSTIAWRWDDLTIDRDFQFIKKLADATGSSPVVRIFLCGDGRACPEFAPDGSVIDFFSDPKFVRDLDFVYAAAQRTGVKLLISILDHRFLSRRQLIGEVQVGGRSEIFRTDLKRESLTRAIASLQASVEGRVAHFGTELISEPEWALSGINGHRPDAVEFDPVTLDQMRDFVRLTAERIRSLTARVSVASARRKWASLWTGLSLTDISWNWYDSFLPEDPFPWAPKSTLPVTERVFISETPTRFTAYYPSLFAAAARTGNYDGWLQWSCRSKDNFSDFHAALADLSTSTGFVISDRGSLSVNTDSGLALRAGYARIQPFFGNSTPSGLAIFGFRQNGVLISEAGVPAVAPVFSGRVFVEINERVNTGIAIANPSPANSNLTFYFTDSAGQRVRSGSAVIPPGRQLSAFLDQAPFNGPSLLHGSFTFESNVAVGAIALRGYSNARSEFLISTLPVSPTVSAGATPVVFPHFADGGGWITQFVLVNPADEAIRGTLQFLDAAGRLAAVNVEGRTGSSFDYTIAARSAYSTTTTGFGSTVQVGSVRVTPADGNSTPSGVAVFSGQTGSITISEAGVPAASPGSAFRVFAEAVGSLNQGVLGSVETGVAVANTGQSPAIVKFELTTAQGESTPLSGTAVVPGNGQIAKFLSELPGFGGFTPPFQGLLRISSEGGGIAVTPLRGRLNERREFLVSTIPAVNEDSTTLNTLVIPHFASGGGWSTQFVLFSGVRGQTTFGGLRYYGPSGEPAEPGVR